MRAELKRPWLIAELPERRRALSWSLNRPGFSETRRIAWREVRDAELSKDLDVDAWFSGQIAKAGLEDAICLLTSRDIGCFVQSRACVEQASVSVIATVGLGNAERIGARHAGRSPIGTINIAMSTSCPLSDGALVEAVSLVAEARTLAVLEAGLSLPDGAATGTGTDCIVVTAPNGPMTHAGKHTPVGEAIGRAALDAVRRGVAEWEPSRKC